MNNDDFIQTQTYKLYTKIVKRVEEDSLEAIKKYCQENNIIPNLINEEQLIEILKLGLAEYEKRLIIGSDKE